MGFLKKIKAMFAGTRYRVNREILIKYLDEVVRISKEEKLSFGDEFFLMAKEDDPNRLHVCIINYDVDSKDLLDAEKHLSGMIYFVNHKKSYHPETDVKYYSAEEFIKIGLASFPPEFYMVCELGEPRSLEPYKC